ncbi:MAG: ABC transporter ATP-binding protein [Planctomycetes bacterium]|nr:ABC transporter ATP-binding protein [Planctomycetota bacterium]
MSSVLAVREFIVQGPEGQRIAVSELQLQRGEVAALHGPSGSGKTTLLQAMFGLLQRPGWSLIGHVSCLGIAPALAGPAERRELLRHRVAFLPQDAHAALDPLQPVGQQIVQATGCDEAAAVAMLGRLGVADAAALSQRCPHAISGGQAQRVLLAIAFLRQPALVVADEPSASLDGGSYDELVVHLKALVQAGSAVLLATHDHRLSRDLGAKVWTLRAGEFVPGERAAVAWPGRPQRDIGTIPVLAATGVRHAFGPRTVLDGVDFTLMRGEIVAIVGESGAGKTTLVRVLVGHLRPDLGTVNRPARRSALQLVCQDAFGSLTPGARLGDLLAEAKAPYFDPRAGVASVRLAEAMLERTRDRMSGGERRRAALLRALAVHPDVLVLDEPTASLDRETAAAVLGTLLELQRSRGLGLVVVTHDLELAHAIAHRVLTLRGGKLCG